MKQKNLASRIWFIAGLLTAATFGAFANLPSTGNTSGSMAPIEDVSEISAKRHSDLSFDGDFKRLSALQGRYRENLPLMKRRTSRAQVRTSQSSRASVKPAQRSASINP